MDIETSSLILEAITADAAQMLIVNPKEFYYYKRFAYHAEWPNNALKALLPFYLEKLEEDSEELGFGPWIIRDKCQPVIVGDIGFKGKPGLTSSIDIGYHIIPEYRNNGYAAQAVSEICRWAFDKEVKTITAACDKNNIPSQKVLSKNKFKRTSDKKEMFSFKKVRKIYEKKYQKSS